GKESAEYFCIDLPDAEGWCLGHAVEDDSVTLAEFVRRGETVENWTEMITRMSTKNLPNADIDVVLKVQREGIRAACAEGWDFKMRDRGSISGRPARIYVARCKSFSKDPQVHESVWGTSETQVHLVIAGPQNLHTLTRAMRTFKLDEATVDKWISFLKTARICDNRQPLPLRCSQGSLGTELFEAAKNGQTEKVETLLKDGADPNAREQEGDRTALMIAAVRGHRPSVLALLNAGADVNARSGPGITALMAASGAGQSLTVKVLLDAGTNVNTKAPGNITALMMAAVNGDSSTVQALVNAGADVNARAEGGTTALMMAAD
ncbi:MAG: ankyrin repeat domain-containing protein, partial [Dehalococcoidia bacterium]